MVETTLPQSEPTRPAVRVLVVDNDRALAETIAETLAGLGEYQCVVAFSGPEGAQRIATETFDLVVTDLVMNEVDGMQILHKAKEYLPDCEVIVITGHASVEKAVEAMRQGAFNFLEKPVSAGRLRTVVEKAADAVRLRWRNLQLEQRLDERFGFEKIIYSSDKMRRVVEKLKRIAPTDADVLITGPSGTGKELVAQALHQNSPRKKKPFVALNCAAVAEHLVESELFGHVRGAFTDAVGDRVGKFEYANGGTLFLDEVGDMPTATQIKLFRVLEDRQITRVGDNKPIKVNVRVISATNSALKRDIENGKFRRELYYRLNVLHVELPSLADRRQDVIPLVDFFRRQFAKDAGKTVQGVSPAARRKLYEYPWPGNVRELRNVVQSMVVLDVDGLLDVDDLPPELADAAEDPAAPGEPDVSRLVGRTMEEIERYAIEETLKLAGGNREEAARILDIGARTLYRKLEKYQREE